MFQTTNQNMCTSVYGTYVSELYTISTLYIYNLIDTSNGLVMFANFHQLFNYSILEMVLRHTKMF